VVVQDDRLHLVVLEQEFREDPVAMPIDFHLPPLLFFSFDCYGQLPIVYASLIVGEELLLHPI
jgi:hypothetical protein